MPSPWAALTSAPCLISALTASASPRIAASATGASGFVAARSTARDRAPTTLVFSLVIITPLLGHRRSEAHRTRAVAEALHVVQPQHVEHGQHRVGHRRAVR